MNQDMSIIPLVLHASPVVQLVMAGLLGVSLASWTVIFGKFFQNTSTIFVIAFFLRRHPCASAHLLIHSLGELSAPSC